MLVSLNGVVAIYRISSALHVKYIRFVCVVVLCVQFDFCVVFLFFLWGFLVYYVFVMLRSQSN